MPISVFRHLTAVKSSVRGMLWCHIFLNLRPFLSFWFCFVLLFASYSQCQNGFLYHVRSLSTTNYRIIVKSSMNSLVRDLLPQHYFEFFPYYYFFITVSLHCIQVGKQTCRCLNMPHRHGHSPVVFVTVIIDTVQNLQSGVLSEDFKNMYMKQLTFWSYQILLGN